MSSVDSPATITKTSGSGNVIDVNAQGAFTTGVDVDIQSSGVGVNINNAGWW